MAIQVSGVNVIDNERNLNVGILTATSIDVPPVITTFSPADASSDNSLTANIVLTYNTSVSKGSGNITLNDGSAGGSVIQTIAVSSSDVTISGGQVTINPNDFPAGKDIYVVVPAGAFTSTDLGSETDLLNTYNFTTGPITTSSFSPSDGATNVAEESNIVITFSENISKGTGNILFNDGSAGGTTLRTIAVSSGEVSVSGTQATIDPSSNLTKDKDIYVVIPAGAFLNSDGDAASGNAIINTYNFETEPSVLYPNLGGAGEGGNVICNSGGNRWIAAPRSVEVVRCWYCRYNAILTANTAAACGDWFIPDCNQLLNPGWRCQQYWDDIQGGVYWSNTECDSTRGRSVIMRHTPAHQGQLPKTWQYAIRAFRCVSY